MNYDLAMMALEGLTRAHMNVSIENGEVIVEASPATYKEFARLCLLLGGGSEEEGFELKPGVHVDGLGLKLKLSS
jgi:hypothetical protein